MKTTLKIDYDLSIACRKLVFLLVLFFSITKVATVFAKEPYFATESSSNLRWAVDISSRFSESLRGMNSSWKHAVGLDLHKVFQNDKGDYGTLLFQPYIVKLTNVNSPPFFFDDGDDWELTWRMTNFNYTGIDNGRFNIRIGHYEVPFGLEQNIDTNGTLRQFTFSNRGIKADWGVTINGVLDKLDYELSVSNGSGNDFTTRDSPYLFSGRIGTPSTENFIVGLSGFWGEVLNSSGTSNRKFLGVDFAYYIYQWELLMEASGGEIDNAETINYLTEISWRSPSETLHFYTQLRQVFKRPFDNWNDSTKFTFGVNYDFNTMMNLSAFIEHDINVMPSQDEQTNFTLQLRIRL